MGYITSSIQALRIALDTAVEDLLYADVVDWGLVCSWASALLDLAEGGYEWLGADEEAAFGAAAERLFEAERADMLDHVRRLDEQWMAEIKAANERPLVTETFGV